MNDNRNTPHTRTLNRLRSCAVAWASCCMLLGVTVAGIAAYKWNTRPQPNQAQLAEKKLAALNPVERRKICAHRANNIPMYRSAARIFDCVEIDVVIEPPAGGLPAVYHPPHENHFGLTLQFLLTNERLPDASLWLDVKDLSINNWALFLDQLVKLIPESRRGDIIVETSWMSEDVKVAATEFRANGFLFSYYLPTESAVSCAQSASDLCAEFRSRVLDTLTYGFSHLSFDSRTLPFVSDIREEIPHTVRLLTWDMAPSWPDLNLLRDVDTYIVRFYSRYLI